MSAAHRLRSLIRQFGLSRADTAALLREIAAEFDATTVNAHLRAAAEHEAERLRGMGITVTAALDVRTLGAAMILGRAPKTLRNWRACGAGPIWRSDGGIVWYSLLDVVAWRGGASRTVPIIQDCGV